VRDLARLPKAHLHVHLENAVRWDTLAEIAVANGVTVPAHLVGGRYAFAGFADFFEQNTLVRHCLQRPDDFRRIAHEFCADEAASGVRYAEVSFTAGAHGDRLGDDEMPLVAVLEGLAEGARFGIECRVVLDHSRRRPVERAWRTVRLATKYRDDGVVAVGLAGDEAHPAAPFADAFRAARDAGLHRVPHAGEALGADSIRAALDLLDAERLGHGVRVLDDADLVAEVRERGVALEVCPTSNVALGFSPSLAAHALPRLVDAGLAVTLNTDIPAMLGVTLADEYANARAAFGYDDAALARLAVAGIDASYADPARKAVWRAEIAAWLGADPAPPPGRRT
jgi:adenosine deaminase